MALESPPDSAVQTRLQLVTNWFDELKRLVPIL